MNPSPRVSVCTSRRQHGEQGSCQRLARKDLWNQVSSRADEVLSLAGQSLWKLMPRETSMVWNSTLVCGAQQSQKWSRNCFSYTLKVGYSTILGLFDKYLGTPDAKWGISPEAYLWVFPPCRRGCSDHVCRYRGYVSFPDVSALT